MKKLILTLFISTLILACSSEKEDNSILRPEREALFGLASPIQLQSEESYFLISEYFVPEACDSIIPPPGVQLMIKGDSVFLKGNCEDAISYLDAYKDGFSYQIPIIRSPYGSYHFEFDPGEEKYMEVRMKGSFNAWNPQNTQLSFTNGKWQTELSLRPGEHEYLLVADDQEMLDPGNENQKSNGMGGMNSIISIKMPNASLIPSLKTLDYKNGDIILSSSTDDFELLAIWENSLLAPSFIDIENNKVTIDIPDNALNMERSYLRIYAYNKEGLSNDVFIPLNHGSPITSREDVLRSDKHAMSMYFLLIDRFNNGDKENDRIVDDPEIHPKANYFGGDLQGVIDKIDDGYFDKMGINTIWLSPITKNPESAYGLYPTPRTKFSAYHGYWPIRSTVVDDRFGSLELLKELTSKAHAKGYNILIDYVANHVHKEHPIYQENPDWVTDLYLPDGSMNTERWDDHRLTTWFDTFLPTLDLRRPEVVEPLTDSALFWLKNANIDGFRHDATKHIAEIFWERLTYKVKTEVSIPEHKSIYQIGETYGSKELINSYVGTGKLDAQFDFNVYDDAVSTFAKKDASFEGLERGLKESLNIYGHHNLMGYISGNQDRARFISYASGDVKFEEDAKLAGWTRDIIISDSSAYDRLGMLHCFISTIPGIPVIYYGDEYGSPGGNDPDNRRQMKFDDLSDKEIQLRSEVEKLFHLRKDHLSLIYGDTEFLVQEQDQWVYVRSWFGENCMIFFNKSNEPKRISTKLPFKYKKVSQSFHPENELILKDESLEIEMKPNSFEIIVFES